MILWLYAKSEPTKAFDFCFDDGILRQYFEFDKQYNEFMDGKADEFLTNVMANCLREDEEGTSAYKKIETVPMSLLVQLGSVVDFNVPMLETVFEKSGSRSPTISSRTGWNVRNTGWSSAHQKT